MNWKAVWVFLRSASAGALRIALACTGLGLALASIPLLLHAKHAWTLAFSLTAGMVATACLVGWFSFLANAIRLCSPQDNQLLPRLGQTVAAAYAIVWLTAAGILTSCALFLFHQGIVLSFLGAATILWFFTLFFVGRWGLYLCALLLATCTAPDVQLPALVFRLVLDNPLTQAAASLALVATTVLTAKRVFSVRGDQAFKVRAVLKVLLEPPSRAAVNQSANAVDYQLKGRGVYFRALEKAVHSKETHPPSLLRYGLGPGFHWSLGVFGQLVITLAFCIYLLGLGIYKGSTEIVSNANTLGVALLLALAAVPWLTAKSASGALYQSRKEQALLRLLPGVPQGRLLNKHMVSMSLQTYAIPWASATVVAFAVSCFASFDLMKYPMIVLVSTLPAAFTLVGNYAAMKEPPRTGVLSEFACIGLLFMLFFLSVSKQAHVPLGGAVVGVALLCAIVLLWRCKQAISAPVALPVGRMPH